MSESSLLGMIVPGDRLLLDTTVLAAFLDAVDETHPVARYVLKDLVETGRNHAVVSMITVMEILVLRFGRAHRGITRSSRSCACIRT